VQYKTAFVMAHKLREALALEVRGAGLDGEVEIDGAYFGGTVRPENRKEDRKDRRLKENRSDARRVVIALRERGGRTLSFVGKSEAEGVRIALNVVDRKATIFADEATHWDLLDPFFASGRVNHSEEYSDGHGKHTNGAESYFSRLRRMVAGQHHFVSAQYLHQYAAHAAWVEDHRANGSKALVQRVVANAMSVILTCLCLYWQCTARAKPCGCRNGRNN
jgi:ISXO2-like transposase domain